MPDIQYVGLERLGRRMRSRLRRTTRILRLLSSRHFRAWGRAALSERPNDVVEAQRAAWLKSDATVGRYSLRVLVETASKDAYADCLLAALVRSRGSHVVLELGTNIGLSGTYLASALPSGGRLVTIDQAADRQALAAGLFDLAGVADRIDMVNGSFVATLDRVAASGFDVAFVDGDHTYDATIWLVERLIACARPGAVVVLDDINHSPQMRAAWAELSATPGLHPLALTDMGVLEIP